MVMVRKQGSLPRLSFTAKVFLLDSQLAESQQQTENAVEV
jgi:hypothetical protein